MAERKAYGSDTFQNLKLAQFGALTVVRTLYGERIIGKARKNDLFKQLKETSLPLQAEQSPSKTHGAFQEKIMDFRLRLIGALSLYSFFSGEDYKKISGTDGIDCTYLFWYLGAAQDDIIDKLPKNKAGDNKTKPDDIKNAIFNPQQVEANQAFALLQSKIDNAQMDDEKKNYLRSKIEAWYNQIGQQESEILNLPLSAFNFDYSKQYREQQNQIAGEVIVALLNWDKCLDPKKQVLEKLIPRFSFMTQMIDDILDTPEDLMIERPSFVVGALVDYPQELKKIKALIAERNVGFLTPAMLKTFAPQSFEQIDKAFFDYTSQIADLLEENNLHGKDLVQLAKVLYRFFPKLHSFVQKLNPNRKIL